MQRLERYAVIALVFLIVTIAAVTFWGDGRSTELAGRDGAQRAAEGLRATPPSAGRERPQTPLRSRETRPPAPLSPAPAAGVAPRDALIEIAPAPRGASAAPASSGSSSSPASAGGGLRTVRDPQRREGDVERGRVESPREALALGPPTAPPGTAPAAAETRGAAAAWAPPSASPSAPPASGAAGANVYVVQPGDTLSEISLAALGTSKRWRDIQMLNGNVQPQELFVGQKLVLPKGAHVPLAARQDASTPSAPRAASGAGPRVNGSGPAGGGGSGRTYVVRAGDVLSTVAQRELGSARLWKEIAALNPGLDPDRILAGTSLVLPGAPAQPAAAEARALIASAGEPGTPRRPSSGNRVR